MKIFFFSRHQLIMMTLIFILIISVIGGVGIYVSHGSVEKTLAPVYYQGNTGEKVIAFDINVDWGEEYVPQMLDILAKEKIGATFFVTGTWAQKHPELVKLMREQGHDIANHGYRHLHLTRASDQVIASEIIRAEDIIHEITGSKPTLFSPPYGEINSRISSIAAAQGYQLVMWSLDTIDWQKPSPQTIADRIIKRLHNDAIVLMHPTAPTTKALPIMIAELKQQGYKVKKVKEIISPPVIDGGAVKS